MKRCLYHFLMLAVLLATGWSSAHAGEDVDKKVRELPHLLGSNNTGTDFWMTFLPAWPVEGGINNIKIYVSSGVETEVTVEVEGQGFIQKQKTKPNDIIEFVLPVTIAQPYFKTDRHPTPPEKIYREAGVHVYADDPIICYGVTRYQYTSDGFLAIPTSGLGKEYQVASFSDVGDNGTSFGQYMPSLTSAVAAYDNTKVIFTLGGNLITRTAGGMKPGDSRTFTLNKGDVLPIGSFGKSADLSGSKFVANKPIAVISGNFCAYIPEDKAACDHIVEMELPVTTWGTAYHVTKIFGRQQNSLIKVFAAKPNTKIFLDGRHIYTIQTPGGTEGTGWMFRRVAEGTPKSYILSADGPISVTQHNPGQQDDNISSDPFQLILTPIEQFQTEITFNTPGIGDGSGFARNYVNVVFELNDKGEMPLDFEWATVENGDFEWESVGERHGFFFEQFAFPIAGKSYGMKTIKLPRDGVYKIRSKLPFAAYAYGFSDYDSYGFPTSVALGDLTKPDTVEPESPFEEVCTGCYKNITVTDKPDDPKVRSNLAEIYMDTKNSYNYEFKFDPFVAGENASTKWSACPIDKGQDAMAILHFKDRRGNTHIDTLIYEAFRVTITPTPIVDFGAMKVGEEKTIEVTLTNNSPDNPVVIDKIELADMGVGFSFKVDGLPVELPANGGSAKVQVTFKATKPSEDTNSDGVAEPFTTDMIVGNDCSETSRRLTVMVGEPQILVDDWDYGTVSVNSPGVEKAIQIINPGSAPLEVTGATGPANSVFTIKAGTLPPYPFTVNPGTPVTFTVVFKPTAVQDYTDNITFISNATGPDPVCELKGKGVQPGLEVVGFTWDRLRVDLGASGSGQITVKNEGTESVRINTVNLDAAGHGTDFILDNKDAVVGDLGPGQEKTIPVTFRPTDIGPRELKIIFNSTIGERTAILSGTGVYARVVTEDYTFAEVVIPPGTPSTHDVEFTVDASSPYADPIEITGLNLVETDNGFYSYDIANNLFKGDGTQVTGFPITLQQGEKLILRDVTFTPTAATPDARAQRSMRIETVDDTEDHATNNSPVISEWNGTARLIQTGVGDVEAENLSFELCVNDSEGKTMLFGNPLLDPVTVGSIEIVQTGHDYFKLTDVPSLPMELPAGSDGDYSLTVIYTPQGSGTHTAKVVFKDQDGNILKEADVTGRANVFETTLGLSHNAARPMRPGSNFTVTVSNPTDITDQLAAFEEVTLTVTYDGRVTKILPNTINPGSGYNVSNIVEGFNTVTFTVSTKTPGLMPEGPLATIEFSSYLATNKSTNIKVEVTGQKSSQCLAITGNDMDIEIGLLCVLNMRAISTTGETFRISQNYPNPSGSQTTIDLSVAFEVPATLTLYNSMGEVVEVLLKEQLAAGKYQLDLSTTNLPSGTYFYRIEAGPFVETRQMVIAK